MGGTRPSDLVFYPTSACRGVRGVLCHYCPSPYPGDIGSPGGAGLTSKPHRDRSTTSRLTWAVSPAAGIGLPGRAPRCRGTPHGATTDPDGCHMTTLACPGPDVRSPDCLLAHVGAPGQMPHREEPRQRGGNRCPACARSG